MFSPLHNEMTEALTALREQQEKIATVFDQLNEVAATASTKDRAVKATVDGQGRLTEVSFQGRRWREMAPKELGAKVVEAVAEAQRQAAATTNDLMGGLVPAGVDLERLRAVGPDLETMIDSAIADAGRWSR